MPFTTVRECPSTEKTWQQVTRKCARPDQYHCLLNENSVAVEGCINPILIEPGKCPSYNSKVSKLDAQTCQTQKCPSEVYLSNDNVKYTGCIPPKRTSEAPVYFNITESTEQTNTTLATITKPVISISPTAVVIPVISVVLMLSVIAAAIVWYKHKRCRESSESNPFQHQGSPESIPLQQQEDSKPEHIEVGYFTRDCLVNQLNIKEADLIWDKDLVDFSFRILLKHKILALCGQWGSGRRTLAIQTALKLEKWMETNYQYRIIENFMSGDISVPSQPTIIIMPNLYKPWYTDHHIKDIIEHLRSIRFQDRDEIYLIATFRATNSTALNKIFNDKKFDTIFPLFTLINLFKTARQILQGIAEKFECRLEENMLRQLEVSDNSIGKPFAAVLYCKNMGLTNQDFLKSPSTFILYNLKTMSECECIKFLVLVKVMVHGGRILKTVLENDANHWLFAEVADKTSIMKCVRQLLGGYLEETNDGCSYQIIHDVITRCIFLTAWEKYFRILLQECSPCMIAECVRVKTWMEWFTTTWQDLETFSIAISTESYSEIAGVLKRRRNEMSDILRIARFFEDKGFQIAWNNI